MVDCHKTFIKTKMKKASDHILTTFVNKNYSDLFSDYTNAIELERVAFKEFKKIEFEKEKFYDDFAEHLLGLVCKSNLQAKNFLLSSPVLEINYDDQELVYSKSKYLIDHLVRKVITIFPDGIGITHSSDIYLDKEIIEKIEHYPQLEILGFVKNVINPINEKWKKFGTIKVENPTKATRDRYQINFYSEPNIGHFLPF